MLGPLDKRIRRTRCAACSRRRIKCHGGIPCHYCQKTQQECLAPVNRPSQDAVFVIQTPQSHAETQNCQSTSLLRTADTVPSSVPSDQLTLLTKHFFTEFLAANSFASSILIDPSALSSLFNSSPGLYNATIAIAALDASRPIATSCSLSTNQSAAKIVALKAYRASCVAVQTDLLTQDVLNNSACLWSTLFLGIFELMYDVSGNGWVQHMLYGTSRMLQLRGPERHVSGAGRSFFLTVRAFEICRALIFSAPTFLAEEKWKRLTERLWEGDGGMDWHPKEGLFDLMICCAELCSRTGDIIRQSQAAPLPESNSVLLGQAAEGIAIQNALYEWHSDFQLWPPTRTPDPQSIVAAMYYHATLIFLSGIFDYYHHWDAYSAPKLSLSEVCMHVSAILDLCEVGLRTTNLTGPLFFYPLRVAGARATTAKDKRRILEMLGEISRKSFVVADAFVLDLNEWWQLTRLNPSLSSIVNPIEDL